jgi:hypothetical protein
MGGMNDDRRVEDMRTLDAAITCRHTSTATSPTLNRKLPGASVRSAFFITPGKVLASTMVPSGDTEAYSPLCSCSNGLTHWT